MKSDKWKDIFIGVMAIVIVIESIIFYLFVSGKVNFEVKDNLDNTVQGNDLSTVDDTIEINSGFIKEDLTGEEQLELEAYFNDLINSQIVFLSFGNPSELFLNKDSNFPYLSYIISRCEYAEDITDGYIPKYSITFDNIKKVLNEKMNYRYSDDEIKSFFVSLFSDTEDIYIILGGGAGAISSMIDGYKIGNEYYITLDNGAIVSLRKVNDNYYFFSSTGTGETNS